MGEVIAAGAHQIVLDPRALRFIDSAGLGVVVGPRKRARDEGVGLALASPRPSVARVLEMTGLAALLLPQPEAPRDRR